MEQIEFAPSHDGALVTPQSRLLAPRRDAPRARDVRSSGCCLCSRRCVAMASLLRRVATTNAVAASVGAARSSRVRATAAGPAAAVHRSRARAFAAAAAAERRYKLLYGSTTGNSMMFAMQLGEMMAEAGIANEVADLHRYDAVRRSGGPCAHLGIERVIIWRGMCHYNRHASRQKTAWCCLCRAMDGWGARRSAAGGDAPRDAHTRCAGGADGLVEEVLREGHGWRGEELGRARVHGVWAWEQEGERGRRVLWPALCGLWCTCGCWWH